MSWVVAGAPTAALIVAVMGARSLGNDKAPYLVLAVLAITLLALVGVAILTISLRAYRNDLLAWLRVLMISVPLLYAALVIGLARQGLIDSQSWLGFR